MTHVDKKSGVKVVVNGAVVYDSADDNQVATLHLSLIKII